MKPVHEEDELDEDSAIHNPMLSKEMRRHGTQLPMKHSLSASTLPRNESTASMKASAPKTIKPFNNISIGESALLRDIEKQEEDENYSRKYSNAPRLRATSVADELGAHRARRGTLESVDSSGRTFNMRSPVQRLIDFLDILVPKLQQRVNIYCFCFFLVCLMELSSHTTKAGGWLAFFFCIILIDCATSIADHAFFVYFVDKVFVNHYKIAYLLHGFNGPLGVLVAIAIIGEWLSDFSAAKSLPNWSHLMLALTFVMVCVCMKNWFTRKHYTALLEKRFVSKLFKLETWAIVLSELATTKPPKVATTSQVDKEKRNNIRSLLGLPDSDPAQLLQAAAKQPAAALSHLQQKVIDVFADLVDATSKYNDDYEDDVDVALLLKQQAVAAGTANSSEKSGEGISSKSVNDNDNIPHGPPTEAQKQALKSQIRRRKTFWELAARMSSSLGTLKILTYNGPVTIQRKFQAKAFGKSLYKHLTRGGKIALTTDILRKIFEEKAGSFKDEEMGWTGAHGNTYNNYTAVQMISPDMEKDTATLLFETAEELFDPFHVGTITEDQCIAALCIVYKEARFAASSLNEYGELHQSLRTVTDVVFWLVMMVVLQAFLQLNLFTYILPFITLALTVSFALSNVLGNLFVDIMFVFFMVPYDIGNKIYIGADPNTRIVGYVKSVSLLYTTINTIKNELVSPLSLQSAFMTICRADEGPQPYAVRREDLQPCRVRRLCFRDPLAVQPVLQGQRLHAGED